MSTEKKRIGKRFDELCYFLESGAIEEFTNAIQSEPELVKQSDNLGHTLLSRIVDRQNIEAVRFLLESGADINAPGCGGGTPLEFSIEEAQRTGDLTTFFFLLEKGANIEARGSETWTALHAAAAWGVIPCLKVLLSKGADLRARETIDCHWTPLMTAAFAGQLEAVRILLELGAEPKEVDLIGETAESLALERGYTKIVQILQTYTFEEPGKK